MWHHKGENDLAQPDPRFHAAINAEEARHLLACPRSPPARLAPAAQAFDFDRAFPPEASQAEVFEDVSPLVTSALDGYNVCIFAFGQTGTPAALPRSCSLP